MKPDHSFNPIRSTGSLAQMVERTAFNRVAEGSIPSRTEVETLCGE
jgi:hypothetical protein